MKSASVALAIITCLACSCIPASKRATKSEPWEAMIQDAKRDLQNPSIGASEKGIAMIRMARAYSALEKDKEALSLWSQIIEDPEVDRVSKARAQYRLGLFYDENKDWEKAIEHYRVFSSQYDLLSDQERDNFDYNTENGDLILCHVGQICELQINDAKRAEHFYLESIKKAKVKNGYDMDSLTELLGDFYSRQQQYDKAIVEYEIVSASFQENESEMASPVTRPEYKIIQSLMLAGRKEEAKKRYDQFMKKWGKAKYQLDKEYIERARVLMKEIGPGGR